MNKMEKFIKLDTEYREMGQKLRELRQDVFNDNSFKNGDKVKIKGANKYGFIKCLRMSYEYDIITYLMKEKPDGTPSTHHHSKFSLEGIDKNFLDGDSVLLEALIKIDS